MVKQLLENVDTIYDFKKSRLYKHMKFRDVDETVFNNIKKKQILKYLEAGECIIHM